MSTDRNKFVNSLKVDNRRKIKNNPAKLNNDKYISKTKGRIETVAKKAKAFFERTGRRTAAIGATVLVAGMMLTGCTPRQIDTNNNTEITVTQNQKVEDKEIEQINNIDSISEVEEDFIKRYVEAYNEAYERDIKSYNVVLLDSKATIIEVDGKYVAVSSNIQSKKETLKEYGTSEIYGNDREIIQLLANENEILGSYDVSTGKFLFSGNHQMDLIGDSDYETPTFEKLGISKEVGIKAGEAIFSRKSEGEQSRKVRIDRYKNARKAEIENSKEKSDDGFGIDDD